MDNYTENQQFDYLNKPAPQFQTEKVIIPKMVKDMKFVGIITLISGVLNCMTIFGLPIGIPMIFMGSRLRESADFFHIYNTSNDQFAFANAIDRQYKYFHIQKIMFIISLVLVAIFIMVYIALIALLISHGSEIFNT